MPRGHQRVEGVSQPGMWGLGSKGDVWDGSGRGSSLELGTWDKTCTRFTLPSDKAETGPAWRGCAGIQGHLSRWLGF